MFSAIADGFGYLFSFLGDGLLYILQGIGTLLQPVFDVIIAIGYFFIKLFIVLGKVVWLVITVGRLIIGLVAGLFSTLLGLSYSGATATLPPSYQNVFNQLRPIMQQLQLDNVAYLFRFGIWAFTAFYAIRIIGSLRGGGSSSG